MIILDRQTDRLYYVVVFDHEKYDIDKIVK